jgi:hypothetical protein
MIESAARRVASPRSYLFALHASEWQRSTSEWRLVMVKVPGTPDIGRLVSARLVALAVLALGCSSDPSSAPTDDAGDGAASSDAGTSGTDVGRLSQLGSMVESRAAHTASTLPDGRVLISGGFGREGVTHASAELYDHVSRSFTATRPLTEPRQSHTATLLANGRVLIAGGFGAEGASRDTAEIYDPIDGTFKPTGALQVARGGHVAVPLRSGEVLLVGGVGRDWTFLTSAELYDPDLGTFVVTGNMSEPREQHSATLLDDGTVLVAGGHHGRQPHATVLASAELYDPATRTFRGVGAMRERRHKHDATLLSDGRLLISGGADERDAEGAYDSSELYDPASSAFGAAGVMQLTRYKHAGTSIRLPDGRVLVGGGSDRAELYRPESDQFALVGGDARMPGLFSAAAALPSGAVILTGGYGRGVAPTASTWIFEP